MNKILLLIISIFFISSTVYAGVVEDNIGKCGLGSKIWGKRDGLLAHFFAISTNYYTIIPGTISGTSGCQTLNSSSLNNQKVEYFVANNMTDLAEDISRGDGEYLDTLAVLLEVDGENKDIFNKKLQTNFKEIYSSPEVSPSDVTDNIINVLKG